MSDLFAPEGGWRVRILDLSGGAEEGVTEEVGGFPTLMQANAFARAYVRDSLERCRVAGMGPREVLDASSLSTLVQMVGAGIGVTLIPEMAVTVETRSAPVTVSRFKHPQPSRTIGMVWRKTSPLAPQLQQIADVVSLAARELRAPKQDGAKEPAKRAGRRKAG